MGKLVITGMDRLQRRLAALEAMPPSVLRDAAEAGATPIREEARTLAPRRTGNLARNIDTVSEVESRTRAHADTGPNSDAWYGIFQELGTKHHNAHPFLRPASDRKAKDARREAADVVGKYVARTIRRD